MAECNDCEGGSVMLAGSKELSVLVVGCKGCEGVSVMMVGYDAMSVLVVGCGQVGYAANLLLGLPVSIDILGLPLGCFKSSSCVREGESSSCIRKGPSLTLKFSLMAAVLSCVDS